MNDPAVGMNSEPQGRIVTPPLPCTTPAPVGTWPEGPALLALRQRYREDRDLFGARERARLGWMRWLVQSGRLVP